MKTMFGKLLGAVRPKTQTVAESRLPRDKKENLFGRILESMVDKSKMIDPSDTKIKHPIHQPGPRQPFPEPKSEVDTLIEQYFGDDLDTANAVFTHESQKGKYFQNFDGYPAYGVGQVYLPAHRKNIPGKDDVEKVEWLKSPKNNIEFSRKIYDESKKRTGDGWRPWESYTTGKYKKYLKKK